MLYRMVCVGSSFKSFMCTFVLVVSVVVGVVVVVVPSLTIL
jgi:hypothetical protein